MVNTSLFEQLKRLQTPQTSLLLQKNKRPSLLFDPREAANISRSTFYEIGISGLEQLIELNLDFDEFKISLFDETSKDFERAVENLETNQKLNDLIRRFLLLLSPYFLVKPTQKALEWLIVRYRIHEYNADDLFCLALPYHGTRLFARLIQLFDFKSPQNSRWGWLLTVQRKGVPLSKNTLINQCISDGSLLHLICSMTEDSVKIFGDKLSKLATLFAFYCTTIVGVIQNVKSVTEIHMTHLLPSLMYGLSTDSPDYVGSVLIIIGVLCTKTSFKVSLLHQFVNKVVQIKPKKLTKEMILTLNVLYQMEDINKTNIPEKAIKHIVKNGDTFVATLKMLTSSSISSNIFYLVLIRDSLKLIEKVEEDDSSKIKHFIESLLKIMEFTDSAAESLIRIMIETGSSNSDEWYCKLVQNMENQYPNAWDNVVPILIKSELRDSINHLLGFTSVGSHIEVFQKINDPNVSIRTEVIKYIAEHPDCFSLKYLETSLIARWNDEEPEVLLAMYQLPDSLQCYAVGTLKMLLLKCWKNINTEWQEVLVKTIEKISKLEIKNNQSLCILLLLPHLITQPKQIRNLILQAINIPFFKLIETDMNKKSILKMVMKHLQCDLFPDINDILFEFEQLNPESVYTMTVLFLICSRFHIETCSNTKQKVLNFFFEVILPRYNKKIKKNIDRKMWNNNFIKEYFEKTRRGSLPVEIILHCVQLIIEGLKFEENIKTVGWLNFSEDSSLIIVQLFRHLIINSFTEESKSSTFRSYIDLFLQVHFTTFQSRVNFICCVSVFDFTQENIRIFCIKLIYELLKSTNESYSSWVLNLDTNNVVIPTLLTNIFTVNDELRSLSVKIFALLVDCIGSVFYSDVTYLELLKCVVEQKEEVLLDYRQMISIVNTLLNPDSRIQDSLPTIVRVRTKKILDELVRVITNKRTPPVISMTLLEMLEDINDRQLVCSLIVFATDVLSKENYSNLYEITQIIVKKLDASHVPLFKQTTFRTFIDTCFLNRTAEDGKFSVSNLLMSKLSIDNIFDNLDDDSKQYILNRILDATVQPHAHSEFLSGVSSFVKRITLSCDLIVPYLISMENVIDQILLDESRDKSLKESISEIPEWIKGIKLLEYIQSKKKLTNTPNVIPLLFRLLQKCMEVEEEISMEYTKQVCLSCISNCAEKIDSDKADEETFEKIFNIELIVNCIRVSSNPQTHHHALMLLSQCSRFAPQQVLHNIMSIFTFMGSSVLRQDDSFSFQIIVNIMETLVPLLIINKNSKLISEYPDAMVISCLKVFATSVLDIPDHRRIPLLGKLIRIVGQESFLWCFIVLVLERDVSDTKSAKPESGDSERVALIKDFCFEFDSGSILKCCSELLKFVNQLPHDKDSKGIEENYLFRIKEHSNKELRHMNYLILSFCSSILSSNKFISQLVTNDKSELGPMEIDFAIITEESLKQLRSLMKHSSKAKNESSKYWKVLIYLSLDILNKVNALLPGDTFLNVLQNLLNHDILLIKRKMLELLNWRLQRPEGDPSEIKNPDLLIKVIDRLLEIVADSNKKDSEVQLNCQTGLISLKLLTRVCNVSRYIVVFKKVLRELSNILKNMSVLSDPVLASTVLCIAELTFALKVHAIESLPIFIPALISLLTNHNNGSEVKNDVILLSVISSLYKVVEALPNFLSPYLELILYEVCVLPTRLQDQYSETKSNILNTKLKMLKQKISNGIADRVLLPLLCNCLVRLYENGEYDAVQYLMEILSESFKPSSGFSSELIHLFLSGLEFRCRGVTVDLETTNKVESYIIEALCNIALKCSESSFRPFYLKLYDWGVLSVEYDKQKDKLITYYRILCKLSEKFKSLFIIFAPTFIRNAAQLLERNNISKSDSPGSMYYGEDVNKAVVLIDAILYTLYNTFKYGTVKFVTKERFNVLCEPLVDQIENTIGDYENRSKSITDCVAHFAAATTDDSLWKQFINLVLMKTRHSSYQVRLTALDTVCTFATLLGDNFQPFLPETVPFIAELLEDENEIVEKKTRVAIQNLEAVLKEPIQKYF